MAKVLNLQVLYFCDGIYDFKPFPRRQVFVSSKIYSEELRKSVTQRQMHSMIFFLSGICSDELPETDQATFNSIETFFSSSQIIYLLIAALKSF